MLADIRKPLTDTSTTVGKVCDPPAVLVPPRLGVAWSPSNGNQSNIRAGIGLYYDQLTQDIYGATRWLPPFYRLMMGGSGLGTFRNLAVTSPNGLSLPVQFHIAQPYSISYTL